MAYPPAIESVPELIAAYQAGPALLSQAVAGVNPADAVRRPPAGAPANVGTWSILELVAHLADSEQIYSDRIKRTAAMDKALLMGFDESLYIQRLAYQQRDLGEELELIAATRRQMGRILRALPAEAWSRQGVHNERGLISLKQFVQTATQHLIHHAGFLAPERKLMSI